MVSRDSTSATYRQLREAFSRLVADQDLGQDRMEVTCARLTAEEAIGRPRHDDYPIIRGREFMVAARLDGSVGQAFTDTWRGDFVADLAEIVALPLQDSYTRSVFIASLNAVCRSLGIVESTVHCKDDDPLECADRLVDYLLHTYPSARRVLLVGCQPRMIEALSRRFDLRVNDLDAGSIGAQKSGVTIDGPEMAQDNLEWADCAVVTGTTVVNGTLDDFRGRLPTVYYGVTVAGAAHLLWLDRFCHCGR
jgi:putative heavy-metal chelation protein